ncbi:hypothetical protein COOONC_07118 [Cooperia oncophora]
MEEGTSDDDDQSTATSSDGVMERIILHVYDDESKEFSSLTTYHGMSGSMLFFYHSHPTFFKTTDSLLRAEHLPAVTICKVGGAHQWRNYREIKSLVEMMPSFDAMFIGQPLNADDLMNLRRLEDTLTNVTGSRFNLKRFLEDSR